MDFSVGTAVCATMRPLRRSTVRSQGAVTGAARRGDCIHIYACQASKRCSSRRLGPSRKAMHRIAAAVLQDQHRQRAVGWHWTGPKAALCSSNRGSRTFHRPSGCGCTAQSSTVSVTEATRSGRGAACGSARFPCNASSGVGGPFPQPICRSAAWDTVDADESGRATRPVPAACG